MELMTNWQIIQITNLRITFEIVLKEKTNKTKPKAKYKRRISHSHLDNIVLINVRQNNLRTTRILIICKSTLRFVIETPKTVTQTVNKCKQ